MVSFTQLKVLLPVFVGLSALLYTSKHQIRRAKTLSSYTLQVMFLVFIVNSQFPGVWSKTGMGSFPLAPVALQKSNPTQTCFLFLIIYAQNNSVFVCLYNTEFNVSCNVFVSAEW